MNKDKHAENKSVEHEKLGTSGKPLALNILVNDVQYDLFTLKTIANPSMNLSEVVPNEQALAKFKVDMDTAKQWIKEAFDEVKKLKSFK